MTKSNQATIPGDSFTRLVKWTHEDNLNRDASAKFEDALRETARKFPDLYSKHVARVEGSGPDF